MTDLSTPTQRKLAHRSSDDVDVTLVRRADGRDGEERDIVCVHDRYEGVYFEIPAEPYLALDVYHYPFIYRDFSTVVDEDSFLAAAIADVAVRAMPSGMEEA